ncbi:MAG: epoxyqueuosine reductase QueH [Bulleidia sp.]
MNETEKQEYLSYIRSRKSSNRHNYHKECLKQLQDFRAAHPDRTPRVVLHACCVVCACWPMDFLVQQGCEVTVFFSNSNIWPKQEYVHRRDEVIRYLDERWHGQIGFVEDSYDYETYEKTVLAHRGTDPEGWKSCFACYAKRMDSALRYADQNGFDLCTSVLTFSRQKDSQKINEIGLNLTLKYGNVKWLVSDFKKDSGALKSDAIVNTYDLYRQDYCGCRYSYAERHPMTQ